MTDDLLERPMLQADPLGRLAAPDPAADHGAITRLADDLLPALIAKLTASGLGELEVRQAGWRIRLRMPAGRSTERGGGERRGGSHGRAQPGHAGHGHAPAAVEAGHRDGRGLLAVGPGRPDVDGDGAGERASTERAERHRVVTSPAVGFYEPRRDVTSGRRVHEGDRLGTVDVLGIRQDVLAPVDGIVGASLVEPGEPVEYGQELLNLELLGEPTAVGAAAPSEAPPTPVEPAGTEAAGVEVEVAAPPPPALDGQTVDSTAQAGPA
ncbi:MAG TPA: hypothetical protein VF763_11725 [Candidatus Limnocylindrales bacterium]